jgi:hypothetical protein
MCNFWYKRTPIQLRNHQTVLRVHLKVSKFKNKSTPIEMRAAIFFLIASALVVMTVEVSANKDGELPDKQRQTKI